VHHQVQDAHHFGEGAQVHQHADRRPRPALAVAGEQALRKESWKASWRSREVL
jgi:hypothetical protein